MKKIIAMAIALTASTAFAAVGTTKHNMANFNGYAYQGNTPNVTGGGGDVCLFCHCAHTPSTVTSQAPLWNRSNPTTTSASYVGYSSPTISRNIGNGVDTVSGACLSCHDGQTAVNTVIKYGGKIGTAGSKYISINGDTNVAIGPNLSGDHPISLVWNNAYAGLANSFPTATFVPYTIAGIGSNVLTCAGCHEPHGTANSYFLRASPNSGFCALCHVNK